MKKLQSLGKNLTREEQKHLFGGVVDPGGTCRYHYYNGFHFFSDCMSRDEAIAGANQAAQNYGAGYWCCDSCASQWGMGC